MRILMWDQVRKELEKSAAFNVALLRAIDPRIISHRPRDPEKARLMQEMGLDTRIEGLGGRTGKSHKKNSTRRSVIPSFEGGPRADPYCEVEDDD